ncbi:hypothetical protein IW140_005593 [Coemansia sp. RSA 1813]|nr:hypothetical protein EV178_003785 [Coemansia sp. RSA 1646]KAJ1767926.1 hypothetical protein LPJ74_005115 [Coemansia sp. RSA 1843]KAJ2086486.1 hypothetical protein IW138_005646 [Coemansia sp. RSA 986]KAJ2213494.1 hypothetical protein EV179_003813 [Coemansia sp. RSA 487]KAJ2564834.1 hypothetical protein IW140_005593 [Coemansia sp. RSA 1813]
MVRKKPTKAASSAAKESVEQSTESEQTQQQVSTAPPADDSTKESPKDGAVSNDDAVAAEPGSTPNVEKDTGAKSDTSNTSSTKNQRGQIDSMLADGLQEVDISEGNSGDSNPRTKVSSDDTPAQGTKQDAPRSPGRRPLSPNAISIMRTSSKLPATSHPLQDSEHDVGPSSSVSTPKRVSFESTAGRISVTNQGSHRTPGTAPANRSDIAEVSESEEDDPFEAQEEENRRRFRLAEQRRLQKEQLAQKCVSPEEMETMRSGLYNARESPNPIELRVLNGSFPDGLRGSLVMVGPGRFDISYNVQGELEQSTRVFTFGNLMDALPLLTKITFDPNAKTIVHRSRLIAKHMAGRIQSEHGINAKHPGSLYMSDSNQTVLTKFIPRPTYHPTAEGDCCSQSVQLFVPLQGSSQNIVCTNHTGALQNIDPVDLRPRAVVETKAINKAFACTLSSPHMQYDSDTREHFTVLQDVGFRSTTYSVVSISEAHPNGYVVATFSAQASVLHSFSITQDYIIVPVYPYEVPVGGPGYRWSDSLLETLEFDRSQYVLFYVISREYRRVHCAYKAPAFFALHQINAVQETAADSVSIDCIAYEDDTILRRLRIDSLRKANAGFAIPSAQIRRYQLQRVTMEAQRYISGAQLANIPPALPMVLRSEPAELACIGPAFSGKRYTYVYGVSHVDRLRGADAGPGSPTYAQAAGSTVYNCLVKLNIADATEAPKVWSRKHCHPSEPVFVPRSSDKEDDGYVVTVFFDSMRIASCLLVLDAATFQEILIAQLPSPVPFSFGHAKFAI